MQKRWGNDVQSKQAVSPHKDSCLKAKPGAAWTRSTSVCVCVCGNRCMLGFITGVNMIDKQFRLEMCLKAWSARMTLQKSMGINSPLRRRGETPQWDTLIQMCFSCVEKTLYWIRVETGQVRIRGGGGGGELLHCPHPPRFSLQPKMPNARLIGPLGGEKEGEGGVGWVLPLLLL